MRARVCVCICVRVRVCMRACEILTFVSVLYSIPATLAEEDKTNIYPLRVTANQQYTVNRSTARQRRTHSHYVPDHALAPWKTERLRNLRHLSYFRTRNHTQDWPVRS